jgi:hypothetical protein
LTHQVIGLIDFLISSLTANQKRSSFTPDPSNFGNQSPAFVEDARPPLEAQSDGALLAIHQLGAQLHPNSPPYIGENFANPSYGREELANEQLNIERRCANRLQKLLVQLKRQYYYDNKLLNNYYYNNFE